jgi:hypothetical protein
MSLRLLRCQLEPIPAQYWRTYDLGYPRQYGSVFSDVEAMVQSVSKLGDDHYATQSTSTERFLRRPGPTGASFVAERDVKTTFKGSRFMRLTLRLARNDAGDQSWVTERGRQRIERNVQS